MTSYQHLFFDLDRTLWDYDKNSREALAEILENHGLIPMLQSFENFLTIFNRHNEEVWEEYKKGLISKEELRNKRFELTLKAYGMNDPPLAQKLNDDFLILSPKKTHLIEGAIDLLTYLKSKHYHLYILTNGFTYIQLTKMKESGLTIYFDQIFTSDKLGHTKPQRKMFEYAIKSVNAKKNRSIMIGDELQTDIIGAQNFGIDQVYFNPLNAPHDKHPTYEISNLAELKVLL